ncbi:MAG: FAD-dependent oxidoreductase [Oscillospiraceae bacterium]|jgi:NAD(P)H-nitrite reductase large subunit|nr:FAD-dependent oxidoreductase [Oscillospiraceae bacterium]
MRIVIVGNSTAAVGAIEGIRLFDQKSEIIVIANEEAHTYSRPLISYLLEGKTDLQRMKYRPDDFYERHNVTALLGQTVTAVDAGAHELTLAAGGKVPYDKLVWAAGSRPFIPPVQGLDSAPYYTFQSLADAEKLASALSPDSRVLIIGAGLIGLKCAEGIAGRCARITIADIAPRILPSILDEEGAALVQAHAEKHGIRFHLGNAVQSVDGNTARLADGTALDYDILVVASGVKPNLEPLTAIGAKAGRGILTDANGLTSLPDIYAAGDVAESLDITDGLSRILAILPGAYQQGKAAGKAIAGFPVPFDEAMPVNSLGLFGLHMGTAGVAKGESTVTQTDADYRRFFFADGKLVGFILIGDLHRAGIYTALVRAKIPLDTVQFDPQKPALAAFAPAARQKMINGENA